MTILPVHIGGLLLMVAVAPVACSAVTTKAGTFPHRPGPLSYRSNPTIHGKRLTALSTAQFTNGRVPDIPKDSLTPSGNIALNEIKAARLKDLTRRNGFKPMYRDSDPSSRKPGTVILMTLHAVAVVCQIMVRAIMPSFWPLHLKRGGKWAAACMVVTSLLLHKPIPTTLRWGLYTILVRSLVYPALRGFVVVTLTACLCNCNPIYWFRYMYYLGPWWIADKVDPTYRMFSVKGMSANLRGEGTELCGIFDDCRINGQGDLQGKAIDEPINIAFEAHHSGLVALAQNIYGDKYALSPEKYDILEMFAYLRIIDDFHDMNEDRAAGKPNFFVRREDGSVPHEVLMAEVIALLHGCVDRLKDPDFVAMARGYLRFAEIDFWLKPKQKKRYDEATRLAALLSKKDLVKRKLDLTGISLVMSVAGA